MLDPARIAAIRAKLQAIGSHSWTSATFQNQVLSFIGLNAHRGDFVIEVGCFRGGLTAQLSDLTSRLGKELYVVDIDQGMLDHAAGAVKEATGTIPASTQFFCGDLEAFLVRQRPGRRCILAFIDGDHRYEGVVRDIQTLLKSRLNRPLTVAFHDYALRYDDESLANVLVDEAIRDTIGGATVIPLGDLSGLSALGCEPSPATGHAYYYKGGSEGALVTLPRGFRGHGPAVGGPVALRAFARRLKKRYLHAG